MKKISKVLIANRGEIAVRIMHTCREMGIATVAVFSEADRKSLHVMTADEAYCIGPAPSAESYLGADKIIAVAKKCGAEAIHPGYGFLSEKEHFSRACFDAGVIFIGPGPEAIAAMGNKVSARNVAKKAGVPMVPGTMKPVADIGALKKLAGDYGYPVLLKAVAGGGGKGMRVVRASAELASAFQMASSEALKSFGDGSVYLEKYLENPRHVEIQIAGDTHGNGLFLLERECSLQRRHQKVIEEAPCFYLKDEVRQKMAEAALNLAAEVGYVGVGTVEFLVDDKQCFYFLEMNTRLQVEHTVTEMITGLDLVRLQIEIARGEKFRLKQDDIVARGHAVECRVYAEDPANGFMPSPGKILAFRPPQGRGIRNDTGVYAGAEISVHYDPLISKLIAHAENRELALARMQWALTEFEIDGPRNNLGFLQALIDNPDFKNGKTHTQYLDKHPELANTDHRELPLDILLALAAWHDTTGERSAGNGAVQAVTGTAADSRSIWSRAGLNGALR